MEYKMTVTSTTPGSPATQRGVYLMQIGKCEPIPEDIAAHLLPDDPRARALIGMVLTSAAGDLLTFDFNYGLLFHPEGIALKKKPGTPNVPGETQTTIQ